MYSPFENFNSSDKHIAMMKFKFTTCFLTSIILQHNVIAASHVRKLHDLKTALKIDFYISLRTEYQTLRFKDFHMLNSTDHEINHAHK